VRRNANESEGDALAHDRVRERRPPKPGRPPGLMCTQSARPSTVPWLATYDAGCLDPASHCSRPAWRLRVKGSSPTSSDGTNRRTSGSELPGRPGGESARRGPARRHRTSPGRGGMRTGPNGLICSPDRNSAPGASAGACGTASGTGRTRCKPCPPGQTWLQAHEVPLVPMSSPAVRGRHRYESHQAADRGGLLRVRTLTWGQSSEEGPLRRRACQSERTQRE
jgi:hypothetical protein